jgi:perosamine synthetase
MTCMWGKCKDSRLADRTLLPYGRHFIDDADIGSVVEVLKSDWLTTGPAVERFERALADYVGSAHAVAVSSGTAALHAIMYALGIGPGDEVIVPPITFVATANAVVFQGGTPVFADVDPDTLLIDPLDVEKRITARTRALVAVDYAGQPCDYEALRSIAQRRRLAFIADSCHALGAGYGGRRIGSLADLTAFSFHPVKHITTGEGGMVTTDNAEFAGRMRMFRNHGITTDHRQRSERGSWSYEMEDLGYNYRITDIQCALGYSQLRKLDAGVARRQAIAALYDQALAGNAAIRPLVRCPGVSHSYHLYVVRVPGERRQQLFAALRARGIGVNVHYQPVYLHPFYRRRFNFRPGLCPKAEAAYEQILSLPMFPAMSDADVNRVAEELIAIEAEG